MGSYIEVLSYGAQRWSLSRTLLWAQSRKMSFCCRDTRQDINGGLWSRALLARPHIGKEQLPTLCARGQSSSRTQASMVTGKLSKEEMVGSGSPLQNPKNVTGACHLQHGRPPGTPLVPSSLPQTTTLPPGDHHPPHNHCQCSLSPRAPSLIHPPREATKPQPHGKSSLKSAAQCSGSPHQLSAGSRAHPSCPNLCLMVHTSHSLTTTAPQVTLKPVLAFPARKGRQNHPGDNPGERWEPPPKSCSSHSCALWSSPTAVHFQMWFEVLPLFH